ncbi:emp24/gp25L/p24 family/GOLD-domain-containing protein [Boletus edulis BED1]|uniref:Emp24/gp25L/p24 family/GOLD-domain-containing protein n=1 Tax=Boletus edulis BED1 TaxID=1328754 RepID=A0AAD4BRA3_BOLED|nr:emp24/gp25L/p24 family/GOLD-domain-containing protein [Boletus edulis BED1]
MFPTALSLLLLFLLPFSNAIKFALPPAKLPTEKCIWNAAHINALVIVTANVSPGPNQRIDIEIIDATPQRNVYLSKKDIKGETRLAVTAHAEDEIGVCFKNHLAPEVRTEMDRNMTRTIDLDVDVGADAVDYNAIANQESLSGLETEMRKLEGVVKEIVDELNYLKKREEKFADTNLSTNERVQTFAWLTLVSLVGLGVWQIFHLRAFFKRKYLID